MDYMRRAGSDIHCLVVPWVAEDPWAVGVAGMNMIVMQSCDHERAMSVLRLVAKTHPTSPRNWKGITLVYHCDYPSTNLDLFLL